MLIVFSSDNMTKRLPLELCAPRQKDAKCIEIIKLGTFAKMPNLSADG